MPDCADRATRIAPRVTGARRMELRLPGRRFLYRHHIAERRRIMAGQRNEGEGNRTAARRYNKDQQEFVD